jgi:lipid-A-disaccharide synthase
MNSRDILILTNGPGELATWVRPVVLQLREQLSPDEARISIVFSPCPNATGREATIASSYPGVDRVQAAKHFFPFLLWGNTVDRWDWHDRGVVLFLGGDQFYTLVIGKRLGYRTVIYAEWEARWYRWIDRFGVMNPSATKAIPQPYAQKVTIVGDLMTEVTLDTDGQPSTPHPSPATSKPPKIGLLPGSKAHKLQIGVPFMLAVVQHIRHKLPNAQFVLPIAPTVTRDEIAQFADPVWNPMIQQFGWAKGELIHREQQSFLCTQGAEGGIEIELHTEFPAYGLLATCDLCLTTVGANTAELGALAVPMLVIIPTQQMDIMKTWDGLPGIIANLPLVGSGFATVFNWYMGYQLGIFGAGKKRTLFAWPNIWAGEEVVPEHVGRLQPEEIAQEMVDWLTQPDRLQQVRDRLRAVRGEPGAARKLVAIVLEELQS